MRSSFVPWQRLPSSCQLVSCRCHCQPSAVDPSSSPLSTTLYGNSTVEGWPNFGFRFVFRTESQNKATFGLVSVERTLILEFQFRTKLCVNSAPKPKVTKCQQPSLTAPLISRLELINASPRWEQYRLCMQQLFCWHLRIFICLKQRSLDR